VSAPADVAPAAPHAPPTPAVLRRLLRYAGRHRGLITRSVLVLLLIGVLDLLTPDIVRRTLDGPVATGDLGRLALHALLLGAVVAIGSVARAVQQYVTVETGQRVGLSLRQDVFGHLQRMGLEYFDRHPVGMLVTRVTSDIEAVEELFSSGVASVFYDFAKLALVLGWLFWLDALLALAVVAVLPALLVVTVLFTRRSRRDFGRVRTEVAATNAFTQEQISGLRVTRLFDRGERARAGFGAHVDRLREAHDATVFNFAFFFPAVDFLQAVALGIVVLVGAPRILAGSVSMGSFAQFFLLTNIFFEPLRDLSQNFNAFLQAVVSCDRVFRVMDTAEQVPVRAGALPADAVRGRVTFDDVTFGYGDGEPVLRGVSFDVPVGTTLAIVGPTGAGKSSVVSLVPRFYDVRGGRVLVDGRDVRDYEPRSLRARVAVVIQDVFLFSGTLLDNLRLFDPSIPRERVEAAVAAVHADRVVARLPRGLDEEIRERGGNLSLGERQLVAFARALVFDPAILVLDEATASVDTETETAMKDALRRLREGRTTIVIAHRLSTIKDADQILVLQRGEVRERGTHAELLRADGLYRRMYELQAKEALEVAEEPRLPKSEAPADDDRPS
jgi:ATP-binding cassette subfamily B protein